MSIPPMTTHFAEQGVWGLAGLAGDVFDNVPSQDVFDLFLLEPSLDDEPAGAVDRAGGAQLGKEELDDVLWLSVHLFADVGNVGKDRPLWAFSLDVGGRDGVPLLAAPAGQGWVRGKEERVEAAEELLTRMLSE